MPTPVALAVFNRPAETARVVEALRAARPERVFVIADGPRADHPEDAELVERTRAAITSGIDWPCDVQRLYADANLGCGRRLRSGLDWLFDAVPEAIVLEDDCLPHPSWFGFAEAMLERYRGDERIHMVSAMNYFSDASRPESYFFSRYVAVWGWASWARVWREQDPAMATWPAARDGGVLDGLFAEPGLAAWLGELFEMGHSGAVDTWDIQWFWSAIDHDRLSVVPRVNLVSNIGYVGTHGAGGANLGLPTADVHPEALVHPAAVTADLEYEHRLYREWLRAPTPSRTQRARDGARALAGSVSSRVRGRSRSAR